MLKGVHEPLQCAGVCRVSLLRAHLRQPPLLIIDLTQDLQTHHAMTGCNEKLSIQADRRISASASVRWEGSRRRISEAKQTIGVLAVTAEHNFTGSRGDG